MFSDASDPAEDTFDRSGRLAFLQLDEAALARLRGLRPELCRALPGASRPSTAISAAIRRLPACLAEHDHAV